MTIDPQAPMRADELLPCPFCSSTARLRPIQNGKQVMCGKCFAHGPAAFNGPAGWAQCELDAVSAWNRRATPSPSTPQERPGGEVETYAQALAEEAGFTWGAGESLRKPGGASSKSFYRVTARNLLERLALQPAPPESWARKVEVGPDATNPNCLRVHVNGAQWCKVYGFTPEQATARAEIIVRALATPGDAQASGTTHADMAAFAASDAACYAYPGEDQGLLREAFISGAVSAHPQAKPIGEEELGVEIHSWRLQAYDDGSSVHLSSYNGGGHPDGEWSGLSLFFRDKDGGELVRDYVATGPARPWDIRSVSERIEEMRAAATAPPDKPD